MGIINYIPYQKGADRMQNTLLFSSFQIFILFFASFSESVFADPRPIILNTRTETFKNILCEVTDTCSLKEVSITVENYKILVADSYSYGTRTFSQYNTESVADLEDYGFVQLIRGCIFDAYFENGKIKNKVFGYSKKNFDQYVTFRFPDWVIDSVDTDPFFNNVPGAEFRHYYYRWNQVPDSFEKKTELFYGKEKPSLPKLYVKDLPGTSFYSDEYSPVAKNTSLEFRTCIYKTKEIPTITTADNIHFAEPIHCFDWRSSFIDQLEAGKFESPAEIDPFCMTPDTWSTNR